MFVYDNGKGEFYIPARNYGKRIHTWIEQSNAKKLATEVIWDDYSIQEDLIILTHGYWGMIQIDGKFMTLTEYAKTKGDELISLGYKTVNIVCCRSAFLVPVNYKGLLIRPVIISPLELNITEGFVTIDGVTEDAIQVTINQPFKKCKFLNKLSLRLSQSYSLMMKYKTPKIIK